MMKRISSVLLVLCAMCLAGCASVNSATGVSTGSGSVNQSQNISGPDVDVRINLNFQGWYTWPRGGGLRAEIAGNTLTLNGRAGAASAGYVTEYLDKAMKNKKVTLEIKNAAASSFSEGRMMKITVNQNDRVIRPDGIDLIYNEYIPSSYSLVEFTLPDNFDGKLGFVFYEANLNNLQITAAYR